MISSISFNFNMLSAFISIASAASEAFSASRQIIDEPLGGAHRNPDQAALILKKSIIDNLDNLRTKPISSLLETRYQRLMSYGNK